MIKVGVFDSGIGGLSVAKAITKSIPDIEVKFVSDEQHLPYGTKTPEELLKFSTPILQRLVSDGCQVIVVACNTVTTNIIEQLREVVQVPIVAVEPMVKPAALLSKSKIIAVCATPSTLSSKRYKQLKDDYAADVKVLEPDCSNWTLLIEKRDLSRKQIASTIKPVIKQGADVIVLGCTHYHWIEEDIKRLAKNKAIIIQPEAAIIDRLQQVLKQLA